MKSCFLPSRCQTLAPQSSFIRSAQQIPRRAAAKAIQETGAEIPGVGESRNGENGGKKRQAALRQRLPPLDSCPSTRYSQSVERPATGMHAGYILTRAGRDKEQTAAGWKTSREGRGDRESTERNPPSADGEPSQFDHQNQRGVEEGGENGTRKRRAEGVSGKSGQSSSTGRVLRRWRPLKDVGRFDVCRTSSRALHRRRFSKRANSDAPSRVLVRVHADSSPERS